MRSQIIEDVTFLPIKPTPKGLIGFASCTYNQSLALNSIAVYTRPDGSGIRCVYPDRTLPNGKKIAVFYPIQTSLRTALESAVSKKISLLVRGLEHD